MHAFRYLVPIDVNVFILKQMVCIQYCNTLKFICIGDVIAVLVLGWLRGSVVERRSSAGVLSLSCARPVADG